MEILGKRLKYLREQKKKRNSKFTQGYVADLIGVARTTYTAYENGTKQPPIETVNKLADLFNVSTDYLQGRIDNPYFVEEKERKKSAIIDKIKNEFSDADLMFKDLANMSADQLEEVYEFIKFKKSQGEKQ